MARSSAGEHEGVRKRVWLVLCLTLAVHVLDEVVGGFIPQVNGLLSGIARDLEIPGVPQFSSVRWLGAVAVVVLLLLVFTGPVSRRARLTRLLPHALASVLLVNGLGHIALSVWAGQLVAGIWSSSLLLLASTWAFTHLRGASGRAAVTQGAVV